MNMSRKRSGLPWKSSKPPSPILQLTFVADAREAGTSAGANDSGSSFCRSASGCTARQEPRARHPRLDSPCVNVLGSRTGMYGTTFFLKDSLVCGGGIS